MEARLLRGFAHQPYCGPGIAATLHQEIRHLTFAVDGAPQITFLTSGLSKVPCVDEAKLQKPTTYRLVGDIQSALCQKLLNLAKA